MMLPIVIWYITKSSSNVICSFTKLPKNYYTQITYSQISSWHFWTDYLPNRFVDIYCIFKTPEVYHLHIRILHISVLTPYQLLSTMDNCTLRSGRVFRIWWSLFWTTSLPITTLAKSRLSIVCSKSASMDTFLITVFYPEWVSPAVISLRVPRVTDSCCQ